MQATYLLLVNLVFCYAGLCLEECWHENAWKSAWFFQALDIKTTQPNRKTDVLALR